MNFHIQHFKSIPSTNDYAISIAKKGEPAGAIISTDFQSEGHGKYKRKWISPRGKNILFSLLLRPRIHPNQAPMLTQVAGRSVVEVLKKNYDLKPTLKMPNDILIMGKKICGILVESASSTKKTLDYVVIGVGLNVNSETKDLIPSATSLKSLKNKTYSKDLLFKRLITQFKADFKPYF